MLEIKEQLPEAAAGVFLLLGSIEDIRKRTVAVRWIAAMYGITVILLFWIRLDFWKECFMGLAVGAVVLFFAGMTGEKIGRGDGYMVGCLGILLGFQKCLQVCALSIFLSAVFAFFLLLLRKGNRKTSFPFLPFLLAGFLLTEAGRYFGIV